MSKEKATELERTLMAEIKALRETIQSNKKVLEKVLDVLDDLEAMK